ncbi:MAG: hypothetical protein ABL921_04175 [Pirellula sp.]
MMINPLVRIVTLLVIAALTPTFTAIARDPGGDSAEHYAAIDAWLEGITKADLEKLDLALKEVVSPIDRQALKGASNGGYHYFGSAKIFAQMGKAFAEANLKLIKK